MSAYDLTLREQSVHLLLGLLGGVTVSLFISPHHFIRKGLYFHLYLWFLSFPKC